MSERVQWGPSAIASMGPCRRSRWIHLRVCIRLLQCPGGLGMCSRTESMSDIPLLQQGWLGCWGSHWSSLHQTWWPAPAPYSILELCPLGHRCWSRIPWPEHRQSASPGVWWVPGSTASVRALRKIHRTSLWRTLCSSPVRCFGGEDCHDTYAMLSQKWSKRNPRWIPLCVWVLLGIFVRPSKKMQIILGLVKTEVQTLKQVNKKNKIKNMALSRQCALSASSWGLWAWRCSIA